MALSRLLDWTAHLCKRANFANSAPWRTHRFPPSLYFGDPHTSFPLTQLRMSLLFERILCPQKLTLVTRISLRWWPKLSSGEASCISRGQSRSTRQNRGKVYDSKTHTPTRCWAKIQVVARRIFLWTRAFRKAAPLWNLFVLYFMPFTCHAFGSGQRYPLDHWHNNSPQYISCCCECRFCGHQCVVVTDYFCPSHPIGEIQYRISSGISSNYSLADFLLLSILQPLSFQPIFHPPYAVAITWDQEPQVARSHLRVPGFKTLLTKYVFVVKTAKKNRVGGAYRWNSKESVTFRRNFSSHPYCLW